MKCFLGIELTQNAEWIFHLSKKMLRVWNDFAGRKVPLTNPIVPCCKLSKDEDGEAVYASFYK